MAQRLKSFYYQVIVPKLMEQFQYKNKLQAPRIEKIVINRGLGEASQNAKILDSCLRIKFNCWSKRCHYSFKKSYCWF